MRGTLAVLLVGVWTLAAPPRPASAASAEPPSDSACPVESTLELLHDAVFQLDQGDDDARVRQDLREARARQADEGPDAEWVRGFIERIERALSADDGSRAYEAEVIRRDLHESPCLTKEMHARFHRSLPAPGGPGRIEHP